jgi:hypothetical protein
MKFVMELGYISVHTTQDVYIIIHKLTEAKMSNIRNC